MADAVFLSYVREDAAQVDRLQRRLETAGIAVWRDTGSLWPGQDWRLEIKRTITGRNMPFVACFSAASTSRGASYQTEEILIAVEQYRRMPPGAQWLLPVRFSRCEVPPFDLGAGRTLTSLHTVDLFGTRWERAADQLVAAVKRVHGGPAASSRWSPSGDAMTPAGVPYFAVDSLERLMDVSQDSAVLVGLLRAGVMSLPGIDSGETTVRRIFENDLAPVMSELATPQHVSIGWGNLTVIRRKSKDAKRYLPKQGVYHFADRRRIGWREVNMLASTKAILQGCFELLYP